MSTPRQGLLQRLKEKKQDRLGAEGEIRRRGLETAPLSFAQQRLWFLEQLEPGNSRFNILTAVRLRGELFPAALTRALNEVVRRHEALRTRFENAAGKPFQRVEPRRELALPAVDLSRLPRERGEALIHAFARAEAKLPFDLARGPLTRALLLRMEEGHSVLLLTMHQIVVDRWSRGVLVGEMTALYQAFLAGRPSPLPELPIQYADFAVWQREHLCGEVLERLLGYWKPQLDGAEDALDLPLDRPRPAVQGDRGHMQYDVLPEADLERVKALAQQAGTTLFITLWAALAALLHRVTGQEDVVVGTPVANRGRPETAGLIGFFVNMLPLRLAVSPAASFRTLLARAHEVALAAFAHQDLPFERLVGELGVERDLSRHPVFQTTLVLQNTAMPPLTLERATLSLVELDWGSTAFDFALFCWETGLWESLEKGLSLIASYSAELFDGVTVKRLTGRFQNLLREIAADPGRPVLELGSLAAPERHHLLYEAGGPEAPAPAGRLAERIAARARAAPEAPALDFWDGRWTYGELAAEAAAVAERLAAAGLGIGGGAVIGLAAPRGARAIAGLLGILLAGCAYLPLDPEDPAERQAAILDRAGARALLAPLVSDAAASPAAWDLRPLPGRAVPGGEAGSAALVCVLATSGSSGRPKLVGLSDRAVTTFATAALPPLGPGDRVGQLAPLSFDASLYEIWAPLAAGAAVVGIAREVALDPGELARALARGRLTALLLPTALFHRLAREAPALFAPLDTLLVGGESLDAMAVRRILESGPPRRFLHLYGPTEATVAATAANPANLEQESGPVPIGRPLAGARVLLLGPGLDPVPLGAQGEICLSGSGLARGYLGEPDRTAERFLPHPFPESPGERLLRTGDLARRRADGALEFCGRRDRQVKLRGRRLEPEEVEAALTRHPAVRSAWAATWEAGPGDRRLAAYVVWEEDQEATAAQLAEHLRGRLPAWMVPAAFVPLPALPLTRHGKVDAGRLPRPAVLSGAAEPRRPPHGRAEEVLSGVWGQVLGREVGADDNVFDLGGHSLHLTEVVALLSRQWGIELPVRALLELPTVAALAAHLAASGGGSRLAGGAAED